jgi:uncharacterized protein (TIGR03437 family)
LAVTVNGNPVPVQAVTPWQINALLPQDAKTGIALVNVRFQDGFELAATPSVAATAPALITYSQYNFAAVFHGGTGIPADPGHPAQAGEALAIYGFGLGATSPSVDAGNAAPFSPLARTTATAQVTVDGMPVQVLYSGLVPGLAGLYQVNFVLPAGLIAGDHAVAWRTPDSTSPSGRIYTQ